NSASSRPDALAHGIADVVPEDDLSGDPHAGDPVPAGAVVPALELSAAELDEWVATYRETTTGKLIRVERSADGLELASERERITLVPTGTRRFRLGAGPEHLEFDGAPPERSVVAHKAASFMNETFEEIELLTPSTDELAARTGYYRSEELDT